MMSVAMEPPTDDDKDIDEPKATVEEAEEDEVDEPSPPDTPKLRKPAGGMFKTKILILGPCQSGKTTIANYLADATEITGGDYRPTQGVRIVEFESNDLELEGKKIDAEVELWDCSGDRKFEKCWPAIQKDVHGVILVINPENSNHWKELELWYTAFVARRAARAAQSIVFLHQKPSTEAAAATAAELRLPPAMQDVQSVLTSIEDDGDSLRLEFNNFLCSVISRLAA